MAVVMAVGAMAVAAVASAVDWGVDWAVDWAVASADWADSGGLGGFGGNRSQC